MAAEPRLQSSAHSISVRGFVLLLASTVLLSTTSILVKVLLVDYGMERLALAFLRVLIVASALGLALLIFRRGLFKIDSRHVPWLALLGVAGVGLHQLLWVTSVELNGAAVATVLIYMQPAIVAVISVRFLHERMDRTRIAALVMTLVGVLLVSQVINVSAIELNVLGLIAGVGTSLTWASYALLGRYVSRRYSPWTSLFYAFFFGTLFLLPLQLFVQAPLSLGANWGGWAVLLFLALGPTLGGFASYTFGLSHVPASAATIIGTMEPVFTIIFAYFVFGEVLTAAQLVGAALIIISVLLLRPRQTVPLDS